MPTERQPIPIGEIHTVDVATGETHVAPGGMLLLPAPKGTCEWCAVAHPPEHPHNRDSLFYLTRFRAVHGRAPTWTDAMAHCTPRMQMLTAKSLVTIMLQHGLPIPDDLAGSAQQVEGSDGSADVSR